MNMDYFLILHPEAANVSRMAGKLLLISLTISLLFLIYNEFVACGLAVGCLSLSSFL